MLETTSLPGGLQVYLSSILLGFSASLGLAWAAWPLPMTERNRIVSAGLWSLLAALLAGRVAFILADWSFFQNHLADISLIFIGGFSAFGALFGGIFAIILVALLSHQSFGELCDALLPLLGIMAAGGFISAYLSGISYGSLTTTWWAIPTRDEWGIITLRVPLQLLAAVLSIFWFAILSLVPTGKAPAGFKASLGLLGLSIILLVVSLFRVDPTQIWQGYRLETWASLGLVFCSFIAMLGLLIKWHAQSR
jgi:prolipoprotein diacylglyceryltransferase